LTQDLPFHARFGGLDWSADVALPQFDAAHVAGPDPIILAQQNAFTLQPPFQTIGRARINDNGVQFDWDQMVSFELSAANRIGWIAGPEWHGILPAAFFSSMVAVTLAWRGMLPLHASAIILHGKAWLFAGAASAGKSTLVAEMLSAGAQFLSDDLTPLSFAGGVTAWRGRPASRLHPETAAHVHHIAQPEPAMDDSGKWLVRPAQRAADIGWPLGGIIFLGMPLNAEISAAETAMAYGSILFRPRIISALPDKAGLRMMLLELAQTIPMAVLPPVRSYDAASRQLRIDAALAAINRLNVKSARL
jgi:hypothetical protein